MQTLRGRLATASDEDSAEAARWEIPREEWERLAEQVRGKPVTLNYDQSRIVGEVVAAVVDAVGVYVEVEPTPDFARRSPTPPARFGPGFAVRQREGSIVTDFDLAEVSLLGFRGVTFDELRGDLRHAVSDEAADTGTGDVGPDLPPAMRAMTSLGPNEVATLGPEDRLVIRYEESLSAETVERIGATLRERQLDGRCIILSGTPEMRIVGPLGDLAEPLEELLRLILDEEPIEGDGVWDRIAAKATEIRESITNARVEVE